MSPETQQWSTHPHLAYAAIVAIPVTGFMLWADYAKRDLERRRKEDPDFDSKNESGRIRAIGLFGLLSQGMIYMTSLGLKDVSRFLPFGLFVAAVVIQNALVMRLEAAVQPKKPILPAQPGEEPVPEAALAGMGLRAVGWMILSVLGYLAVIHLCVRAAIALAHHFEAGSQTVNASAMGGLALGIFGGLLLSFGLAPFYLRRILPVTTLEPGPRKEEIEGCFSGAKVPVPRIWMVDTRLAPWTQVLYSGFSSGRGPFAPGLFLSHSLLDRLSGGELRAALFREASHTRLHHFRKRLFFGCMIGITAVALAGTILVLSVRGGLSPELSALTRLAAVFIPLLVPFFFVRAQVRRQEEEADFHAVSVLGADAEELSSLLLKLDILSGRIAGPGDLTSAAGLGPNRHPTSDRIFRLRQRLNEANREAIQEKDEDGRGAA